MPQNEYLILFKLKTSKNPTKPIYTKKNNARMHLLDDRLC